MKYQIYIVSIFLIIAGCVTLPKPIDEVYLSEMTEEESAKLEKSEQKL